MLTIRLFGTPHVAFDGVPLRRNAPPKSIVLLAMLVLRDDPVSRTWLAATLWPDEADDAARSNLRRHLHRLAQLLPAAPVPWLIAEGTLQDLREDAGSRNSPLEDVFLTLVERADAAA